MIVMLLGAPGSGKGTQGRLLAGRLGVPYLSSGDLLRHAITQQTDLGKRVRAFVESGRLVPDDLLVPVIDAELAAFEPSAAQHPADSAGDAATSRWTVILDGFPRTLPQGQAMESMRGGRGVEAAVVFLHVPADVVVRRLADRRWCSRCGATFHLTTKPPRRDGQCDTCDGPLGVRMDDQPETVRRRLAVYGESVQPLLAFYRDRGRLAVIDGDRAEPEVAADITAFLDSLCPVQWEPKGSAGTAFERGAVLDSVMESIAS